jgi:hypothetical protein
MLVRLRSATITLASLVALALVAAATPANASVTIGQTDPASVPMSSCAGVNAQDMTQPTVTSGNSYVVPASGTIVSWSHNAYASANQQITMKVWRLVSGTTYRVVGHDGPRPINGPGLVSITGISVPVQAGDVIGLNSGTGAFVDCMFPATGDTMLWANASDAQDGQEVTFTTIPDRRPNISAVVEPTNIEPTNIKPTNTFKLGAITRNKKKGTATLTVNVPNPGELTGSGMGVNAAGAALISKTVSPGSAQLLIKATGKKKKKLNQRGKVKLTVGVTYTPTGGDPATQSVKVKLKKKL